MAHIQIQARNIAAVHDEAARAEDTDWPQILALYDLLKRMSDNPMVMLNHAIAAAHGTRPERGIELLNALDADARWPAIIASTPFAPICWNWPETIRLPSRTTGLPPARARACRNATTS